MNEEIDLVLKENPMASITSKVCSEVDEVSSSSEKLKKNGKKVSIIGSGPAGLMCAAVLARKGYKVTVHEAMHKAGGVLRWGVPSFVLSNAELDKFVRSLGVEFQYGSVVGRTVLLEDLDADAVFVATGVGMPKYMDVEGVDLHGVYDANDYLMRLNMFSAGKKTFIPVTAGKNVVVVGGGDSAVYCALEAARRKANVTLLYRKTHEEMTAKDITMAQDEGVSVLFLTQPSRLIGTDKVSAVECVQMMLTERNGVKKAVPLENSEYIIDCDQVVFALGSMPNTHLLEDSGLQLGMMGNVAVDGYLRTSIRGVFAGGACVQDGRILDALIDGKKAALGIDRYLMQ